MGRVEEEEEEGEFLDNSYILRLTTVARVRARNVVFINNNNVTNTSSISWSQTSEVPVL